MNMFEQMIYNCLPYIVDTLNIQLEMSTYIGEKKIELRSIFVGIRQRQRLHVCTCNYVASVETKDSLL